MRKWNIVIIMVFVSMLIFAQAEDDALIKRKIAIFPFINQNKVEEYDYLVDTIRDAFRAKLQDTDLFLFSNFSEIDNGVEDLDILKNETKLSELAFSLGADVVVMGKFVVIEGNIMISANALDVLQKTSVTSAIINGETGIALFDLVNQISVEMADKMAKDFPKVDKTLLKELIAKREKELGVAIRPDDRIEKKEDPEDKIKEIKRSPEYRKLHLQWRRRLAGGIGLVAAGSVTMLIGLIPMGLGLLYFNVAGDDSVSFSSSDGLGENFGYIALGVGVGMIGIGFLMDIFSIVCFVFARKVRVKMDAMLQNVMIKPLIEYDFMDFRIGVAMKL